MLLRRIGETIAISQPHHAWLAGELARSWGNERFHVPGPREGVICGTALHDIGWLDWERMPRLDPETGLPVSFSRVPAQEHAPMWRRGVELARAYGDLPALIVARHGESIYERFFDMDHASEDAGRAVHLFMEWQRSFCAATIARLMGQPDTAAWVSAESLASIKAFVAALDAISLHICWGVTERITVAEVPCRARTSATLALTPLGRGEAITVDPWPFSTPEVRLAVTGRLLDRTYRDQTNLDEALAMAPTAVIDTTLVAL